MAAPMFVTDSWLREKLKERGLDPDVPGLANQLFAQGIDVGPQLRGGVGEYAQAFAGGAAQGLVNSFKSVADLPFMLARAGVGAVGGSEQDQQALRFGALQPSPPTMAMQAHPAVAGMGGVASFLIPAMAAAKAVRAVPLVGRALSGVYEAGQAAEMGLGRTALRTAQAFDQVPQTVPWGLLAGLQPRAMAARAVEQASTLGTANFLFGGGDLADRAEAMAEGAKFGAIFGAFGPPTVGMNLPGRVARGAAAGALGGNPFPQDAMPGPVAGGLFGALMEGLMGARFKPGMFRSAHYSHPKPWDPGMLPSEPKPWEYGSYQVQPGFEFQDPQGPRLPTTEELIQQNAHLFELRPDPVPVRQRTVYPNGSPVEMEPPSIPRTRVERLTAPEGLPVEGTRPPRPGQSPLLEPRQVRYTGRPPIQSGVFGERIPGRAVVSPEDPGSEGIRHSVIPTRPKDTPRWQAPAVNRGPSPVGGIKEPAVSWVDDNTPVLSDEPKGYRVVDRRRFYEIADKPLADPVNQLPQTAPQAQVEVSTTKNQLHNGDDPNTARSVGRGDSDSVEAVSVKDETPPDPEDLVTAPPLAPTPPHGINDLLPDRLGDAPTGIETMAREPADPSKSYQFRYRVVEREQLTVSHTGEGQVNGAYPQEIQPRNRSSAMSLVNVKERAQNLAPGELIDDVPYLDHGAPIVGRDGVVESGNGRVLSIDEARRNSLPGGYGYLAYLIQRAPELGLDPAKIQAMREPVLVRERLTDVPDRAKFTDTANQRTGEAMTEYEIAKQSARAVDDADLARVQVSDTAPIEQSLRAKQNGWLIRQLIQSRPSNELGQWLDSVGNLSALGLARVKAALFAKVFSGDRAATLVQRLTEGAGDAGIRNIESALFRSIGHLGAVEGRVRAGMIEPELAIADDLADAVGKLLDLKANGMTVGDWLKQKEMFDPTPQSVRELVKFLDDNSRSAVKLTEGLRAYAEQVRALTPVGQETLFGGRIIPSKVELLRKAFGVAEKAPEPVVEAPKSSAAPAEPAVLPDNIVPTSLEGPENVALLRRMDPTKLDRNQLIQFIDADYFAPGMAKASVERAVAASQSKDPAAIQAAGELTASVTVGGQKRAQAIDLLNQKYAERAPKSQQAAVKQWADGIEKVVQAGVLPRDQAEFIKAVLAKAHPDALKIPMYISSRLKKSGAYVDVQGGRPRKMVIASGLSTSAMGPPHFPVTALLHEFAHVGYYGVLSRAEQAAIQNYFNRHRRTDAANFFRRGLLGNPHSVAHFTSEPWELFAQSFSEYVLTKRASIPEFQPFYKKLLKPIQDLFKSLSERVWPKDMQELEPYFLRILGREATDPQTFSSDLIDPGAPVREMGPEGGNFSLPIRPAPIDPAQLVGQPDLPRAEVRRMTPEQLAQHTEMRLDSPEAQTNPTRRRNALLRYVKLAPNNAVIPASRALSNATSKGSSTSGWQALDDISRRLGFSTPHRNSDGTISVRDPKNGSEVTVKNLEAAALATDRLYGIRANHPDMTLPGTSRAVELDGPNVPKTAPDGPVDASMGERGRQLPPPIDPVGIIRDTSFFVRWMGPTKNFVRSLATDYKRITGKDSPIAMQILKAIEGKEKAHSRQLVYADKLEQLVKQTGIKYDRPTAQRLSQVAREADDYFETRRTELVQTGQTPADASRILLPFEEAKVRELAQSRGLSGSETNFLIQVRGIWDELFKELGVPSDEYRIGFYTRARKYGRALALGTRGFEEAMQYDPTLEAFWGMQKRQRKEAEGLDTKLKVLEEKELYDVLGISEGGNYFDTLLSYARNGLNRKYAGDAVQEIQRNFGVAAENNARGASDIYAMMHGDVAMDAEVANHVARLIYDLSGVPNQKAQAGQQRTRNKMQSWALKMGRWAKEQEAQPWAPQRVVSSVANWAQNLGIKATESEVRGMVDFWGQMHRNQTFGFSLMASVRDLTSTAILTYPRFRSKDFGPAFKEVFMAPLSGKRDDWRGMLDNMRERGLVDQMAYPELFESGFQGKWNIMRLSERASWLYRKTDLLSRMLVVRASDRATERAYAEFKKSKQGTEDYSNFLEQTGMDMTDEVWTNAAKFELDNALKNGSLDGLKNVTARLNVGQTAYWFSRWNSPQFMDYAPGRAFGMYGTWALHTITNQWETVKGPWQHYGNTPRAYARTAKLAAKYALAAQATYAIGVNAFGIDSSDWIPFIHNSVPTGGPLVTLAQGVRELVSGDPQANARFEKDPVSYTWGILRQGVPLPPHLMVAKTVWSQMTPPDNELWRRRLGMPQQMDDLWTQFLAVGRFSPANKPLYRQFRQGGVMQRTMGKVFGRLQDQLSGATGGLLPPGTYEGMGIDPNAR